MTPSAFPTPTAEELGAVEIDFGFLLANMQRPELAVVIRRLIEANRGEMRAKLAALRFDMLSADPEVSMLEEREYEVKAAFLSRIQTCFVLEAYMILCETHGITRHEVMAHAEHQTGPIVRGLWAAMYGKAA